MQGLPPGFPPPRTAAAAGASPPARPSRITPAALCVSQRTLRTNSRRPQRSQRYAEIMQFGDYRVEIVPDTEFRLDGGAMFGVVPRKLWSQVCPPDDENRIRMNMNCVFIDTGAEKMLIETGIGEKWTTKQTSMYGIDRMRPLSETLKMRTGCCGRRNNDRNQHAPALRSRRRQYQSSIRSGKPVPAFPNARYFVSRAELDHAEHPTERDRASYLPENWKPLIESGQLETKDGDYEVVPGLRMETIAGHNRSMQCWRLESDGQNDVRFCRSRSDARSRPACRGSWVTTFIPWRLSKRRRNCCRRRRERTGSVCSTTIPMSRCVD